MAEVANADEMCGSRDAIDGLKSAVTEHEASSDRCDEHQREKDEVGGFHHAQDVVVFVDHPGHGETVG